MSWSDIVPLRDSLDYALKSYDWQRAVELCDQIIHKTRIEPTPCPEDPAREILSLLRGKRRFEMIASVAEALIFSGQNVAVIRRYYAQALIDLGLLLAAEPILYSLTSDSLEDGSQVEEAHGLLGRVFKQKYVNADQPNSRYARAAFERSLAEYLQTYRLNPGKNYWHGINAVAMLHRGKADHIPVAHLPDPDALALGILETIRNAPRSPFVLATRAEAFLALGDYQGTEEALLQYSQHENTDAFEAGGTLRQLTEVWRLQDKEPPGDIILPLLRAARMRGEGSVLHATSRDVGTEMKKVRRVQSYLESNFGLDRTVTLKWYLAGLERTKSVARIERTDGKAKGTGWLVHAENFFEGRTGPLLLTNAHVINQDGTGGSLNPAQAFANFQGLQKTYQLAAVVWSSPPTELDATFVSFKDSIPEAVPMPVSADKVELDVPPQRVYIMGHPNGRDIELSIHDNKLVNCTEEFLHYRTPTEEGSSGSPVFDHLGWKVIALHHAGQPSANANGNRPAYEANEGIAMTALVAATKSWKPVESRK